MGSNEPYTDGSVITAAGQNEAHWRLYKSIGLNVIRQLENRDIDFTVDSEECAESYIDNNGRKNTVDTTSTTALYDWEGYYYPNTTISSPISGTIHEDELSSDFTWSNTSNMIDGNDGTYGTVDAGTDTYVSNIWAATGITFSSQSVESYRIKIGKDGSGYSTLKVYIQTYDGSSWTTISTHDNINSDSILVGKIDNTIQGIRAKVYFNDSQSSWNPAYKIYEIQAGTITSNESLIYHEIPTNTFATTVNKSICVISMQYNELDSNIQYKLTNSTEDSGWLDYNEVQSFTAFTSEPTTLIVKLIPKDTSPTAGYPSIRGFYLKAWSD